MPATSLIEEVFRPFIAAYKAAVTSQRDFSSTIPTWQNGVAQLPNNRYDTYAREGYMKNEVVFACIDELATTAAEPKLKARSGNTWKDDGELLSLLNNPNPFMDRFQFWATVIMHRGLAGNAYAIIERSRAGKPVELWMLRPDRVKVVPSTAKYISHYTYDIGAGQVVRMPVEDVIHWKTRHPIDDWYGMPPLMPVSGRVDIDNYMRDFVKSAFENGGMPGAILTVKQKMSPEQKQETAERFRSKFSGPNGWHEILLLDNAESSYTPMTMSLGQRGLVVPELDDISIERICSAFHVFPPLIGYMMESGGYNSLFALERHWWTSTVIPLYKELAGPLNLRLVPNFLRVNEVEFDMSDVWALQEDVDRVATRWTNAGQKGFASVEEVREKLGLPREIPAGDTFLIPSSSEPIEGEDIETVDGAAAVGVLPPAAQSRPGRPSTANDPEARALWQKGEELRVQFPNMTNEQIANRIGVSVTTYWRYRTVFEG